MTDQKILDRARKLHAMAKDKGVTEAEAQAFASKLQDMMAEHRLNMSDVEFKQTQEEPLVEERYCPGDLNDGRKLKNRACEPYEIAIGNAVAESHACVFMVINSYNVTFFVGRRFDVEMAVKAYSHLVRVAEQIAEREYVSFFHRCRREGHVERARGYRLSFLNGFVLRLQARMVEERSRLAGTGLMRLDQGLARARAHVSGSGNIEAKPMEIRNRQGYDDGKNVANQQRLGHAEELAK